MGVESSDVDGFVGCGDERLEVLGEEATMESVGTIFEEVSGDQGMGTGTGEVRMIGIARARWLEFEGEGGGECAVGIPGVTQEEAIGLEGIGCKEETADGGGEEVFGTFEDGGSSMATFGRTIADEEAGDVAFNEPLIEIDEQIMEALVGETLRVRE